MPTPSPMVEVCTAFDTSGACTATAWLPYAGQSVAPLTIQGAEQIGVAFAALWALAWIVRMLKRQVMQD